MVPRDQGWFNIDTTERYFFPGSGLSIYLQYQHVTRDVGKEEIEG